ncbi:hemopexin repeat-containing protein, partial [Salmonella sp. s55044]|uniref:hemopexin repeat-containing protein n=1 Tax=Salmonella sp. s55044 TaxID=3159677 RepID=UPI0039813A06
PIFAVFEGLPSNLDAAVNWPTGKTYFFKGNLYWRTSGTTVDPGYPRLISYGWPGVPDDIDAAVVWEPNGKAYLFKGSQYWRYDTVNDHLDGGYPISISKGWPGYDQGEVDAAFQWSNGKTYLFDGEQYWRYNDDADRIDSGYPLTTTRHWLGCPTDGPTVPMKDVCLPIVCS